MAVAGLGMEAFRTYTALDFPSLILLSESGIFYHIMMLIIGLVLVKSDLGPSKVMLIAKKILQSQEYIKAPYHSGQKCKSYSLKGTSRLHTTADRNASQNTSTSPVCSFLPGVNAWLDILSWSCIWILSCDFFSVKVLINLCSSQTRHQQNKQSNNSTLT